MDTSVWIDYLRGDDTDAARAVRGLIESDPNSLCMTEPVAMELLAGATDQIMLARLEKLTNGLPSLAVDQSLDFRSAASIYRACRLAGRTVRGLADCLIAAVALRHGVSLIHKDVDYETIASVSPSLVARSLR